MPVRTPSYRLHKPSGQAVVTIDGQDVYLGKHGTPASQAAYDRIVAEWLANGRHLPGNDPDTTIVELVVGYLKHCDGYYVKNGKPTGESETIRRSLRVLKRLYGDTRARDFGPLALKTVRQAYIDGGLCRSEVNRRTSQVVRFFRWAVENELVPPSMHHGLRAVPGLRRGRTDVRESPPVRPVNDALVDAIQPHVSPHVWAMIELQRLTGMRPGEVVIMRSCDLDTTGKVWTYTPERHKTEHHGRERVIFLGPRAQAIVREWLRPDLQAFLFNPGESEASRAVELRKNRKTPVQPSQRNRRKPARRVFQGRYKSRSFARAINRACVATFPHPTLSRTKKSDLTADQRAELKAWRRSHHWHPNQLRHTAATRIRREFGIDAARAILGHSSPAVTEVYAEIDRGTAAEIMARVG